MEFPPSLFLLIFPSRWNIFQIPFLYLLLSFTFQAILPLHPLAALPLFQLFIPLMLPTVLLWLTLLAKRFPILYLSSSLHPLLGLSLCLPNLWLIPILLVPSLLTCFHLCSALSLLTRTYPHVLLSLQKSFPCSLLLHLPLLVSSFQGNLGEDSLSGESPLEGALLGENLQEAKGGVVLPSLGTLLTLALVPTTFLFPILYPCFPRGTCLGMEHWICLLDLGSPVTFLRIPQLIPFSLTTPVLPKSFLP